MPAPSRTIRVIRSKGDAFIPVCKAVGSPLEIKVLSYIIRPMESDGTYTFTMLFEPAEEGGFVVTCPALPGLVTEGDTLAEARRMARDAIRAYLESLRKDGEPIPSDLKLVSDPVKEKISVAIPA